MSREVPFEGRYRAVHPCVVVKTPTGDAYCYGGERDLIPTNAYWDEIERLLADGAIERVGP